MASRPLIELQNVDVALNGSTVLRDLNWQLRAGVNWAVLGSNGSGKSTFLKLVRGDLWPVPGVGRRIYRFQADETLTAISARQCVSLVSPELQDRYLQQEWRLSALKVVHSGFKNGDYVYESVTPLQRRVASEIIDQLGIGSLIARNIQQLSTGELRKVLIARALVAGPAVLALDEVCDGLDAPSRADFLQMLERIARSGTQILFATHRLEELCPSISHVLTLDHGRISAAGKKSDIPSSITSSNGLIHKPVNGKRLLSPAGRSRTLLRIEKADVYFNRKKVLHAIDWEIRSDQHWAILGANGAGKTTLLKLAFGDLQAAWGANIKRFEFTARNTVWESKNRIGYVAPELQANYRRPISGTEIVGSGFHSSIGLHEPLLPSQRRKVTRLLRAFGLESLAGKKATEMSYGELRKMILLRALVNQPEILICDEPFDGLDTPARAEFASILERVASAGTRLVIVTHHLRDIPDCITHGLFLKSGHIVLQGDLDKVRAHPAIKQLLVTP